MPRCIVSGTGPKARREKDAKNKTRKPRSCLHDVDMLLRPRNTKTLNSIDLNRSPFLMV